MMNIQNTYKMLFDYKMSDNVSVEIPFSINPKYLGNWNIGLICGASGSGKSSILKEFGEVNQPTFDNTKALISNFDNFDNLTPKEATLLLASMGLASVPSWVKPYNVLSNGEKYRADLAKTISSAKEGDIILIDEFTSVADRNVAKAMSHAVQKYARRNNLKIIFASCHYDIIDWLSPNWIYDLNKGGVLERYDCLRQRPNIELQAHRTTYGTWNFFKKNIII